MNKLHTVKILVTLGCGHEQEMQVIPQRANLLTLTPYYRSVRCPECAAAAFAKGRGIYLSAFGEVQP